MGELLPQVVLSLVTLQVGSAGWLPLVMLDVVVLSIWPLLEQVLVKSVELRIFKNFLLGKGLGFCWVSVLLLLLQIVGGSIESLSIAVLSIVSSSIE